MAVKLTQLISSLECLVGQFNAPGPTEVYLITTNASELVTLISSSTDSPVHLKWFSRLILLDIGTVQLFQLNRLTIEVVELCQSSSGCIHI